MTPEIIAYLQTLAQWHADMVAWVLQHGKAGGAQNVGGPGSSPPPPPPPPSLTDTNDEI